MELDCLSSRVAGELHAKLVRQLLGCPRTVSMCGFESRNVAILNVLGNIQTISVLIISIELTFLELYTKSISRQVSIQTTPEVGKSSERPVHLRIYRWACRERRSSGKCIFLELLS